VSTERFGQCTETCTVDCGHCKGRPVEALRAELERRDAALARIPDLMTERDNAVHDVEHVVRERDALERAVLQEIGERDRNADHLDRLAAAIAPVKVTGEHSSMNDPWENAIEEAERQRAERDSLAAQLAEARAEVETLRREEQLLRRDRDYWQAQAHEARKATDE